VEAPVIDTEAAFQAGAALAVVYFCILTPFYGLSFFLSRIVKDFGVTNVQAGFVTADTLPHRRHRHGALGIAIVIGLGLASIAESPLVKMAVLCIAG
jgi:hypothetical protein